MGEFLCRRNNQQAIYNEIPNTSVLDLVKMNIADKDSRYLMLICRADVATYILEREFRDNIA